MVSQNISGIIYDTDAAVSGAKIMNVTAMAITSSDAEGQFKIFAQPNDTLILSSLFHHTKQVVVEASHLDVQQVFELNKIVNELDEVRIADSSAPKATTAQEAAQRIHQQFETDIEKNPHIYRRANANEGPIDILEIGRRIGKLFKKNTPQTTKQLESFTNAQDLEVLFQNSDFFNDTFLILNLNITKDYKHLFFAYCESQLVPKIVLHPENHIYLIDHLLEYSTSFREILKESHAR